MPVSGSGKGAVSQVEEILSGRVDEKYFRWYAIKVSEQNEEMTDLIVQSDFSPACFSVLAYRVFAYAILHGSCQAGGLRVGLLTGMCIPGKERGLCSLRRAI